MERLKGIAYAALSSSTFGLAPLFTLLLFAAGYSAFEVLAYRWSVAALALGAFALLSGRSFRLGRREWLAVGWLSLLRAATSLALVVAYREIASGVASTVHFMYPLAVAVAMMCFFGERRSWPVLAAVGLSILGAVLLSTGNVDFGRGHAAWGMAAAVASVFAYGGYVIGVRRSCAAAIDPAVFTCCVTGIGAMLFLAGGWATGGIRWECDGGTWLCILGLALPATALSNITLVEAIRRIGPTLTSIFGALEPLTAVVAGVVLFDEPFTLRGLTGIVLILIAVAVVLLKKER